MKSTLALLGILVFCLIFNFDLIAKSDLSWPYVGVPSRVKKLIEDSNKFPTHTPLKLAISRKDYFSIKYLVEHGVDVNQRSLRKRIPIYSEPTPLDMVIETRNLHLINYFLEHGANPHLGRAIGSRTKTAVYEAIRMNDTEIISILYKHGADLNAACVYYCEGDLDVKLTPLEAAIQFADVTGSTDMIDLLRSLGAK